MLLCAYCGKSAESEGHERGMVGGDGPFANVSLQVCPSVPAVPGYALIPEMNKPPLRARQALPAKWISPPSYSRTSKYEIPPSGFGTTQEDLAYSNKLLDDALAEVNRDIGKRGIQYDGDPLPSAPAQVGQHPSMSQWVDKILEMDGRQQVLDRARLGANPRYMWVGPPKSAERINYEMRLKGHSNKARGILKHGPYGSGESGPCDADCAKCASEMHGLADRIFLDAQREAPTPRMLAACEKAEASSRWSAQLRAKVEQQKKRDAEAARYTPYWSPEEQSGGDL